MKVVSVARQAEALADAVERALPGWVERSVERVAAGAGRRAGPDLAAAARAVGREAGHEVAQAVRDRLSGDVDGQATTPLTLVREAVRYPTEVLRAAGVPPAGRDEVRARLFPDDVYDLAPSTLADVDPDLGSAGLAWGAAKAYEHLARRRQP